jgi:hypothetical protein
MQILEKENLTIEALETLERQLIAERHQRALLEAKMLELAARQKASPISLKAVLLQALLKNNRRLLRLFMLAGAVAFITVILFLLLSGIGVLLIGIGQLH